MARELGLFDLDARLRELSAKGDDLERVNALVDLFASQEPREKRRLLNFVLSNCTWDYGEMVATFRQPFDMLAETATAAARVEADESARSAKK